MVVLAVGDRRVRRSPASRAAIERRAAADDVVDSGRSAARSPPRTSTSPSPTPTPRPRRSSCAPAWSRASCASATSTTLRPAGELLAAIAAGDLGRDATTAAATIAEELPVVQRPGRGGAGEQPARAPGRRRLPAAGARTRCVTTILPAATTVYEDAAAQLDDRYRDGTTAIGRRGSWLRPAAAAVLVVALAQLFVTSAHPALAQRRAARPRR